MNKTFKQIIIVVIIVMIAWAICSYFISKHFSNEWKEVCEERGLSEKCTGTDECKKGCNDLNKQFFRYESGGLFANEECWCLESKNTVQIW